VALAWVAVAAWSASLLTCPCGKALAPCCVLLLLLPSVDAGMGVVGVADGAAGLGVAVADVAASRAGRASAWRSISASAWAFLVALAAFDQVALLPGCRASE
jgi:hypothetical protein